MKTRMLISGIVSVLKNRLLISGIMWLFAGVSLLYKGFRLLHGWPWIVLALLVGFIKGYFVLSKTVDKMKDRVPGVKSILLIGVMIGLSWAMKFLPPQVRGFVDVAVGHALLHGASRYLWYLLPRSISKPR